MTTTQLFVELLVIGFGALAWLLLFAAVFFGVDPARLNPAFLSFSALLPLASFAYVLGILVDRVADRLLDRLDDRHRREFFGDDKNGYFVARRTLLVKAPELWTHLEYGRSRLRICRGWALNAVLLLVALDLFAIVHRPAALLSVPSIIVCNLALVIFAGLSFWCWRALNRKEYKKIGRQSVWVRENVVDKR